MPQKACTFETQRTGSDHMDYLLCTPQDYDTDPAVRWPLIYFLHGAGERGQELARVTQHSIPRIAVEQPDFPFVVVAPQCPEDSWWSDHIPTLNALLDEVLANYAVDPERVYLTGISMGGYGTWHLGAAQPDRFAALAPVCGGGVWFYGFPRRVCALKEVPVWAFHGALDSIVPIKESEIMVQALRDCGGRVRFTVYPDVGHDAWNSAYADPELYRWFLSHRRGQPGPE